MSNETQQFGVNDKASKPSATIALQFRQGTLTAEELKPLYLDLNDPAQRNFGDYELIELLGQGAMGVVYRARQISLDREVALKLLASGARGSRDFLERFRKEAQNAARLQHPNIVGIHEIGSAGDINYFSMQLIEGRTLEQRLRDQGRIPEPEAARIVQILAETVGYAHGLNVLHLDLKPANILEERGGRLFIADFGLSKPLDHALANDTNEISGTPSYMAPEQVEIHRHRLSKATDLYALGAILYELLTGEAPYRSTSVEETLRRVVDEPPPALRRLEPKLSRDLEAICCKCMAKEPQARYGDARELAQDLGRFLDGHPISIRKPGFGERMQRWSKKHPVSLGGLAMALLSLVVAFGVLYSTWGKQELEKNGVMELAKSQAYAMSLPDSTPRQRTRKVFADMVYASVSGDIRDIGKIAWLDAAEEIYVERGSGLSQHDARLVLAAARTEMAWGPAFEKRNTPMSNLLAATDRFNYGEDKEDFQAAFALLRKALEQAKGDPVILATASAFCRNFESPGFTECDNAAIRAKLLKQDPDNLFVWAVSAPMNGDSKIQSERFAKEAPYWLARPVYYRNNDPEYVRRSLVEYDAVAAGILKSAGLTEVDPHELASFALLSYGSVGYMSGMQAAFDGLRSYCQGKLQLKPDTAWCENARLVIAKGANNPEEQGLADAFHYSFDDPAYIELDRKRAWRRKKRNELVRSEARYEADRKYLSILTSKGVMAAEQDLFTRYGVSPEPPADYDPKKTF